MKTVTIICAHCSKPVEKPAKEHRRRLREGKDKFFCDNRCSWQATDLRKGQPEFIRGKGRKLRNDEFSPFRYHLGRVRQRKPLYGETDLTVEYLKSLWETQKGVCPYTLKVMRLPANTAAVDAQPDQASLDRINSSKGYVIGNVEYVCLAVNFAKNKFPRETMLEFFRPVSIDF